MPRNLWFQSAFNDAIGAMCEYFNWQKWGSQEIEPAVEASNKMFVEMRRMLGVIFPIATSNPPSGCLMCDGTTYLRVDYPDLFAVLDSAFIVDGDHFVVPDMTGKVPVGNGFYDGPTFTMNNPVGSSAHQLVEDEIPSHAHTVHQHFTVPFLTPGDVPGSIPHVLDGLTGFTGGSQPHNNIQPSLGLNFCIVAQ